jgi:ABC-type dipeptide/oligopeptide/nickel transport system ATPase component
MSSKLIAVVGATGSGKSTSIKSLDPKETFIINVARKELPFKGSAKLYNAENRNYLEIDDALGILKALQSISERGPHIKQVILEDSNYIMGFNMVKKATETGYTKFSIMAKDMVTLLTEARKLRDDLKIFYFSHPESVEDEGAIVSYKMKTAGKLLDSQIVLEGLFTVALYTHVDEDKNGETTYDFVTNRWKKYPAKSPDGMFEAVRIPNNLQDVCDRINDYYN